MQGKRVVVGLSGGVDSSVAAYLLKQQSYDVVGVFMKNWHDESATISDECPWLEDSNDAMLVAEKLRIPFQTVDLSKEYKERVVNYMFNEYKQGRTPNPDVLCNRDIKFDVFLKLALSLGADYVATGHYCQKRSFVNAKGESIHQLFAGFDTNKDQSYFLCQVSQSQLSKALFPIGTLDKKEVRKIAKEQGLVTAEKRDSQGLCFVGKVRLPDFLQQQLKPKNGPIVEIDKEHPMYVTVQKKASVAQWSKKYSYKGTDGKEIGTHNGAHFFTIGQRKGMGVGGTKEPLFVIATDVTTNTLFVGEGNKHPGLFRKALKVVSKDIHWVREDLRIKASQQLEVQVRIRYRQPLQKATLHQQEHDLYVVFEAFQSAITSGQFVAWYSSENELIGSGVIE